MRHRFLNWISQDRQETLHGIAEADETHVLESNKGQRSQGRKSRKSGSSDHKRSISDLQICVLENLEPLKLHLLLRNCCLVDDDRNGEFSFLTERSQL